MALNIKDIIKIARAQFSELLPELSIEPTDIRLEEIERQGSNWAITFSVPNPNYSAGASIMSGNRGPWGPRIAKVIVVDELDGSLVALKERAA
jgi:hypothetical protein